MTNFKKIKTGVIGVGSMGQNHARIYNEISDLVGVADPNESQGRAVADKLGVDWYKDYRDLENIVDAVSVVVPTFLHYSVSEFFIKNKKHVLVEKPLAGNFEDASKIVNLANKEGVTLAVGHIERHNGVVRKIKEMLNDSLIGDITTLSARRFSPYPSRITDVGVLFDLTIHDVDIICHLIQSPVTSVYASGVKSKNENFEDHINLMMKFDNGSIGLCETSWLTPNRVRELSMVSTKCYGKLDFLNQKINLSSFRDKLMDSFDNEISVEKEEPLLHEIENFLTSIQTGKSPLATGADGLNAVKIVEAGYRSLKNHSVENI